MVLHAGRSGTLPSMSRRRCAIGSRGGVNPVVSRAGGRWTAWRSRTSWWAPGWRCGTGSGSATGGRCSPTRSASWPPTGPAPWSCRPGAGRCGSSARPWSRCARCRRRRRAARRWPRSPGWRGCARTPGRRWSTSRSGRGGCAPRAATPGGPTPRWPSATPGCRSPRRWTPCARSPREHGIPPRVQAPVGSPWDRAVAGAGLGAGRRARGRRRRCGAGGRAGVEPGRAADPSAVELPTGPSASGGGSRPADPPTPAQRARARPRRAAAHGVRAGPRRRTGPARAPARRRRRRPPAPVPAGGRARGPPPRARHRAAGRRRRPGAASAGARWAVLQVAVQNDGAALALLRPARLRRAPPLPLPGAAVPLTTSR